MFIRPCEGVVTSLFQKNRLDPVGGKVRSDHNGVDFAKKGKVPILASASGEVAFVGKKGTYGNAVIIKHNFGGKTRVTVYAHLESFNVKKGQDVKQGQKIGMMGNTGNSSGQHLHFEIHDGNCLLPDDRMTYVHAVNPLMWLNELEIAPKIGDVGPLIGKLQADLKSTGINVTVDNSFGPASERAVKEFQKKYNLVVDGKAGPTTLAVLKRVKPTQPVVTKPTPKPVQPVVTKPTPAPVKTISQLADEVIKGLHGTGAVRMKSLGSDYTKVQAEVNRRMRK